MTLVWINGAHGVGKTQVAFELRHRGRAVWVCDPEDLGFALRRMLPDGRDRDFRELATWRSGLSSILRELVGAWRGTVLVPQTLADAAALGAILDPLRDDGVEVHHITLVAAPREIRRRRRLRGEFADRWGDVLVRTLADPRFAPHVSTDGRSIAEVAEHVAREAGLHLDPDPDGRLRRGARRVAVQVRHVRRPQLRLAPGPSRAAE